MFKQGQKWKKGEDGREQAIFRESGIKNRRAIIKIWKTEGGDNGRICATDYKYKRGRRRIKWMKILKKLWTDCQLCRSD